MTFISVQKKQISKLMVIHWNRIPQERLKVSISLSETVNRKNILQTIVVKRKRKKDKTMIHRTLHKKLKIENIVSISGQNT